VSFRLGLPDGVSVVAASWARALGELGFDVRTVAGEGGADVTVPWLTVQPGRPPDPDLAVAQFVAACEGVDLVVLENVLTIPVNLPASRVVATALRGRPALLHHHDPAWQRPSLACITELPVDDPSWRHVVINRFTRDEFAARGIEATTIYNGFDTDPPVGDRAGMRRHLAVADGETLLLHPVRAIERKNVPGALALAEATGSTYWLPGPAEDGYGPTLDALLASARTRVLRRPLDPDDIPDAYAACDAVLFPSTWEGFGNPPMEAATHRKPVVVGHYPVADELRTLGFRWLEPARPDILAAALGSPDDAALDHNRALVGAHCSCDTMRDNLAGVLAAAGWLP
jgi:glycosyltransferase involved in cell wall biosynthesis